MSAPSELLGLAFGMILFHSPSVREEQQESCRLRQKLSGSSMVHILTIYRSHRMCPDTVGKLPVWTPLIYPRFS
jgi:hypothetical protein